MGNKREPDILNDDALMREAADMAQREYQTVLRAIVDCFNNSDTISDFSNAMVEHIEAAEALLGGNPKREEAKMTTSVAPYATSMAYGEKK